MEDRVPTESGKLWAVVCYGSFFFGLPLCIGPLLLRDDAYALHHAKQAAGLWIGVLASGAIAALIVSVLSFFTCGLGGVLALPVGLLVALWPTVTAIHGLVITIDGGWARPIGSFGIGDALFAGVGVKG